VLSRHRRFAAGGLPLAKLTQAEGQRGVVNRRAPRLGAAGSVEVNDVALGVSRRHGSRHTNRLPVDGDRHLLEIIALTGIDDADELAVDVAREQAFFFPTWLKLVVVNVEWHW